MRRRTRDAAWLLAAVGVLLIASPSPALGATPAPSPAPPGTFISYAGEASRTDLDFEGAPHVVAPEAVTMTISCADAGGCTITGWPWTGRAVTPFTGTEGSWTFPAEGAWCNDPGMQRPRTFTLVEATAARLVATVDLPGSGWYECDGGQVYTWGVHYEMTLAYVAGDACVLEGRSCPPEAEPAEVPAAPSELVDALPRTAGTPSVLSTLATPAQTLSLAQCALAAALAVVLALLMGFPAQLLNRVADELSARLGAWRRRRRAGAGSGAGASEPAEPPIRQAVVLRGWWPAALGVLAAAVISSFVDPAFGLDAASLRQLASIAVGFALDVVLGWFVLIWVVGRLHPHATARFEFQPLSLLLVLATVVFTRLTGFQPGIVFGLVAGVAFGTAIATAAARVRLALITLGWGLALAALAWAGYAALAGAEASFGVVFLRETLASVTAAGISALPVALLPVRGLTGGTLFAANRWVWGACYAVGLLCFFLVLMPMPGSWAEVPFALWAWIGMYAVYAGVATGLWLWVVRPWRRDDPGADGVAEADAASASVAPAAVEE